MELPSTADLDAKQSHVENYRERAFRLALRIVGCPESAEDVTQDSLVRASRASSRGYVADEWLWLRRIVIRRAISALKRRRPESTLVEAIGATNLDEQLAVRATLERLAPEQRVILAMAIGEQFSYREIAETLGVPEGTVASRLHAAKEAFRRLWEVAS